MRNLALGAAILLLTLTACGSPTPKPQTDTTDFVTLARVAFGAGASTPDIDAKMITAGHAVCSAFSHGDDWSLVQAGSTSSGRLTYAQAKLFIEASVKTFCPDYAGKLPS